MGRSRAFNHAEELVMKSTVTVPVVAFCVALASASAFAADAQKATDAPKKQGTTAAAAAKPANKPAAVSDRAAAAAAAPKSGDVRDWAKMDTNKDNLISPEEMEAYLKDNPGPLRASK
jgi:hypothetical protein